MQTICRMLARLFGWAVDEVDTLSSALLSAYTGPCLLHSLQPVRVHLQPFISGKDVVRLMRASRSITASLLPGYTFVDRVFFAAGWHDAFSSPRTAADVHRSLAFYSRYRMRITRMCLPVSWNEPLVDNVTGRSVLPASLLGLSLGQVYSGDGIAHAAIDGSGQRGAREEEDGGDGEWLQARLRRWEANDRCDSWTVASYGASDSYFNLPISPGTLPYGLRLLQFNSEYDQPLQHGSIPDTVEVLQFDQCFNQPLQRGHLPSSLRHLVFGDYYNQPLLPGMLPAGLRRLHMGGSYNQPMPPGTLPAQLQRLFLGDRYNQPLVPGAIPSSVTHLRLSLSFNQPLQPGSIPHGVVHLNLGDSFDRPLAPNVLPTSLRELALSRLFNQPLQPGSLPDGLQVLVFHAYTYFQQQLQPGVIPASVEVVRMGKGYKQQLLAGGIPATVRWLWLPSKYASVDLSGVLSPGTRVLWWKR